MTRNNVPNDILTSKNISEQKHLRLPLIYLAINICVKNKTNEIVKRIIKIKKKKSASIIMLIIFIYM